MPSFKCKHPTCPVIRKERGYCPQHQHLAPSNYDAMDRLYDQKKRDKKSKHFYDSKVWQSARAWKISHNPVCQKCFRNLSTMVHHVKPVKEIRDISPELLVADENLLALCASCHSRIEGQNKCSHF